MRRQPVIHRVPVSTFTAAVIRSFGNARNRCDNETWLRNGRVTLGQMQRRMVWTTVSETCHMKGYALRAVAVSPLGVACVISSHTRPGRVLQILKEQTAQQLRAHSGRACSLNACVCGERQIRVWSKRASIQYLWKPQEVMRAAELVRENSWQAM